jgi:hypothetical protein
MARATCAEDNIVGAGFDSMVKIKNGNGDKVLFLER